MGGVGRVGGCVGQACLACSFHVDGETAAPPPRPPLPRHHPIPRSPTSPRLTPHNDSVTSDHHEATTHQPHIQPQPHPNPPNHSTHHPSTDRAHTTTAAARPTARRTAATAAAPAPAPAATRTRRRRRAATRLGSTSDCVKQDTRGGSLSELPSMPSELHLYTPTSSTSILGIILYHVV